jgi:hypothetical protein
MSFKSIPSIKKLKQNDKKAVMTDYLLYYEKLYNENEDLLNIKIEREIFKKVIDKIENIIFEEAKFLLIDNQEIQTFLANNPIPPMLVEYLSDEFRVYSLLLNSLKQWITKESSRTDHFLLGSKARKICRAASSNCIVTRGELGENPELHHPIRDGRPPILLSKEGHELVEKNFRERKSSRPKLNKKDADMIAIIERLKKEKNQSWVQLREGLSESDNCRESAKSFAKKVIRETGLSKDEIIGLLNRKENHFD